MASMVWLVLLPVAAIAAIMWFGVWEINHVSRTLIGRKHHWIEEIVNTGEVPADWVKRPADVLGLLTRRGDRPERLHAAQERSKAAYLRRLDELVQYTENSPLMGDAETRDVLLDRLDEVYEAWERREPASFVR